MLTGERGSIVVQSPKSSQHSIVASIGTARGASCSGKPESGHVPALAPATQRGQLGRRALAWLAVPVLLIAPVAAQAQTAEMTLPVIAKDRGLHSGDFVLHPAITVQGHHDTNMFNGNTEDFGNPPVSATSIRILPRLSLSNDLTSNTTFLFSSVGDARIYVSDNKNVTAQSNIGGAANLDLTFGQRRPLALGLFNHFNRALRSNNWETQTNLNRTSNDVGARVEFHPGDIPERRPFNLALIGSYARDSFEDFKAGSTQSVRTRLTSSWRFLPKTAGILDASWDFRYTTDDNRQLQKAGMSFNSQPFRAKVGLAGALTKRLSFELLGGWGLSMHEKGDTYNNYLATAAIGLRPGESTRLTLGYTHDFRDAFYGNFVDFHRGWVNMNQRFGQIMDVKVAFGASYGMYGAYDPYKFLQNINYTISQTNRKDVALDGSIVAGFEVARLISMDVGYQLRSIITDYKISVGNGVPQAGAVLDVGGYTAHEIYASVTLRY